VVQGITWPDTGSLPVCVCLSVLASLLIKLPVSNLGGSIAYS
jgi:hypothetical protein